MPWLAAAAIAAPIVGGIVGNAMSAGDREKALALQQQALQNIMNVNTPDVNQMKLELQKYQTAGELSPQMEQVLSQNPSMMNSVGTDPRLKNAQMQALSQLQKIGEGGLRPQDVAAMSQIRNSNAQAERAQEQAIMQNMQERGQGGSGAELAAKLSSVQGGANSANMQSLNVGAQANQAALQALMSSGQLGGQMQGQEFSQKAQIAAAQDAINKYNTMNAQQVSGQNTNVMNAAQAQNLANKQNLMNQNVSLENQQYMYNQQLPQLNYQNQLGKAQAAAGQSGNLAGQYNQNAQQTAAAFSQAGQGAGQGAAAYGNYQNNQDYMNILKQKYGVNNAPNVRAYDSALDGPNISKNNNAMNDNYGTS